MPTAEIRQKLMLAGAKPLGGDKVFRGQTQYLPINWYEYKGTKGVVIEIGCGETEVCAACHLSNEIFIDPKLNIKPCHSSNRTFPLSASIADSDPKGILDKINKSRQYLSTAPGSGLTYWANNS